MKALVYNGPKDISIMNIPDAQIEAPTDVLVRITTNICGSDLHMLRGPDQRRTWQGSGS